jgi:hypothetical protein
MTPSNITTSDELDPNDRNLLLDRRHRLDPGLSECCRNEIKEGLKVDDDIIKDKKLVCMKSQNDSIVQDGIDNLI